MKNQNCKKLVFFCLFGFLFAVQLKAQFSVTAEVRPRTEYRNGFKTPTAEGNDPAFFTEQRSRLYFGYSEEKFKMQVTLQDVRLWGSVPQIFKKDVGNTFLSEAWGQYYIKPTLSVKAGRQILSYDNQRFLGGLEWAQQGRRHDAVLLIYDDKEKKTKFHFGLAYNNDDDKAEPGLLQAPGAQFYSVGGNYKSLQYGWFNKKMDNTSISLLALNATLQNPDSTASNKQTLGFIGSTKLGKVKLAGDFYYQTGKIGEKKVNAFLAGLNATIKTKYTPITVGVEHISGKDDDDTSTDITNFSPDYGTNHAFNGFMDYFFVGPANGSVGVTDYYIKTKFKVGKGALNVRLHEFLTGSKQLDGEGNTLAKPMGTELDLVYVTKLASSVTLHVGYSHLIGTETLTTIRPGDAKSNNWAFMMLTFKPKAYKFEKAAE